MAEIAGSNPAVPTFIFKSDARLKAEDEHSKNYELCNSDEKLCNFGALDNDKSLARSVTDRYIDEEGNEQIEILLEELIPEEGDEGEEFIAADSCGQSLSKPLLSAIGPPGRDHHAVSKIPEFSTTRE
jgi:hypothetical protein